VDKETLMRMFSSEKSEYGTPQDKFNFLDGLFNFTLDACATEKNAKVDNFFSIEDDALSQDWEGVVFMNSPFGKSKKKCVAGCSKKLCDKRGFHLDEDVPGVKEWVLKAFCESEIKASTVLCVLPGRVDTAWFQVVWDHAHAVCFVRGRWKFEGADDPALFPIALVVFGDVNEKQLYGLQKLGNVNDLEDGDLYLYDRG
jgi:site-specific DNA-methyltransferase (adenine-specific)